MGAFQQDADKKEDDYAAVDEIGACCIHWMDFDDRGGKYQPIASPCKSRMRPVDGEDLTGIVGNLLTLMIDYLLTHSCSVFRVLFHYCMVANGKSPKSLHKPGEGYDHREALFGIPPQSGSLLPPPRPLLLLFSWSIAAIVPLSPKFVTRNKRGRPAS
jgi:hypothetical protein